MTARTALLRTELLRTELPLTELAGPACCPSGLDEPMDRATAENLARLLKAVADPARLQLLALLRSSPAGEACACDLTEPLGLSQPTVSHHLKILVGAGLLERTQRGKWAYYRVVLATLDALGEVFVGPRRH